jgi:thiol-disulfide isomerase/thioredoxin
MIRSASICAALLVLSLADGQESIKAIDESYQAAVRRIYAAKTEAEEKAASEEFHALRATLVDRALKLAQKHPGSPEAVDALTWVVCNGRGGSEPRSKALETLRREYIGSDRLSEACRWASNTVGNESLEAERLLREAIEKSPHPKVRGWAYFGLAELLESRADIFRDIDKLPPSYRNWIGEAALKRLTSRTAEDLFGESEALYGHVTKTYPDLEHPRTGKTLGAVAEGRAYRLRNLAVGRAIPEIEGVDVEGKPLKLSDHRGEVIVLTFSGIWCPSCHNLYPQQRELLKRHKGRPFAVLSVDTDEDKAPLRKAIESGEIAWPCWWDGGVGGPITVRCGIYHFPTVCVIDRKGVVRYEDIQGPQLYLVVETLL